MLYGIALLVFALDQLIKWMVRSHMTPGQLVPVLPPWVDLDYIQNPGGAFSILPHHTWLFILVAFVVIAAVIYVDIRYKPSPSIRIALGLVLGGALGNMSDRIFIGKVTDYVYLQFIHFPIFNLADVCIDAGVILLIIRTFWQGKKENLSNHEDDK
ncbi:signal peptidase II [Alicyclobacillus tolerans]|uniref:Lipoprotein signal peptidase n=2 Tax=Alicyclobacillus tolerans TaxID=90970 RepID=A0ABT9LVW4_9BACL|nr:MULTISPECIES: signal peptidase II [Alicyclobacillus]MDP9728411.1 signal peptidase II [Alicyclobacillus tengchongensis]SHK15680.1 signal peptidase II [Alicyclobacillus montanus]